MDLEEVTLDELIKGYRLLGKEGMYECLFCGERFDRDEIFQIEDRFFNAERTVSLHLGDSHGSVFEALLQLDKKHTGLSEVQSELLKLFYNGLTDKEIVNRTNANSVSTIRQHRFKLKEKEKQAKVFMAIMHTLAKEQAYEQVRKEDKIVDAKYMITEKEQEKVLATYFTNGLDGAIETFPSKEKRKVIILKHALNRFSPGALYTEKEVNEILKTVYTDYVMLRRYLIELGYMDRNKDGSTYWLKETK
jgi:DNA-binding CsgD family transcriptional regulator